MGLHDFPTHLEKDVGGFIRKLPNDKSTQFHVKTLYFAWASS